jgi:hypothetical protein
MSNSTHKSAGDQPHATRETGTAHAPPESALEQGLPADAAKNPDAWVTGDESMTGPQMSYLKTLSHEAGVEFDETMTKAEASKRIDELQAKTGRGVNH